LDSLTDQSRGFSGATQVEKAFETIVVGRRTMPKIDHQLRRLLKTAAAAPPRVSGAVPFALETRVLGHWRSSPAEGATQLPAGLFRWPVMTARLVMLVSNA